MCSSVSADLVFVLDNSGSIRDTNPDDGSYDNFELLLNFVVDIIDVLDIGGGGDVLQDTRVGLVEFSDSARNVFYLNTFSNKAQIQDAVRALEYIGGNTNTSGGLLLMQEEQFRIQNGDRPEVANVAIVITDGQSTYDANLTIPYAESAHSAGIQIFSVGITDEINEAELRAIASPPQQINQNYFTSVDFQSLSLIANAVADETCIIVEQGGICCIGHAGFRFSVQLSLRLVARYTCILSPFLVPWRDLSSFL